MRVFPFFKQHDAMDCGAACLRMVASFYGRHYAAESVRRLCNVSKDGVSMLDISNAAEEIGFRTVAGKVTVDKLIGSRPLPCILHWNQNHFVVLYDIRRNWHGRYIFHIADPAYGKLKLDKDDFCNAWVSTRQRDAERGVVLSLLPTHDFFEKKSDRIHRIPSVRFLFGYVSQYRAFFLQLAAGLMAGSLLQLALPFLTQSMVDTGINGKDIPFIYLILAGQLTVTLSLTALDFIRRWILLHISMRIDISLLSDFIMKLVRLPMNFFDIKLIGDLLQRMNDHKRVENFLTSQALGMLYSMFSFVVFGTVLLWYDLSIFLIFIGFSIAYSFWISFFLRQRKSLDYEYFAKSAKVQNCTMQLLTGMQEIKLQDCGKRRRWEWEDAQADLFGTNIKSLKLQQLQGSGAVLINQTKNIVITVVSATAVVNGDLSFGMMLAIQYIIGQLNSPVEQILSFVYSWQDVSISLERMCEIHEKKDEDYGRSVENVCRNASAICIEHLSFRYDCGNPDKVLDDICLEIPEGKITAIVGASGSGKTTLLKLILGYYHPEEGHIYIGGKDLDTFCQREWRRQCGVVMQDGFIFSESIARNIAVADEDVDVSRLKIAAETACADEFIERMPLKYNTMTGSDGHGLSCGQKQRILIARAVYKNPPFLIFDEATNSLDANNEREIIGKLSSFYEGKTVIIVAHRLSTVRNADKIVVMDNGRIKECGTHSSLVEKKGVYYNLIKNQLELGT